MCSAPVFEIRSHAGQRLLQVCNDVFCILDTDGEAHQIWGDSGGGQLRIGASDTICRYFLVPYLKQFHKEFPNAHIKVTNQTSIRCVELLETGQVDFIVTNYPNTALTNLYSIKKIKRFQDVFIASHAFLELKNRLVSFAELLKYPLLMLDKKSTTSEFLHNLFQQRQLDLVPEVELSSNDLLIDLARIGLGIAFVPDFCVPQDSKELFILNTEESLPSRELVIAYNEHVPVSKAAAHFMSYFEELSE